MRYLTAFVAAFGLLATATSLQGQEAKAGTTIQLDLLVADVSAAALGEGEVTAAKLLDLSQKGKLDSAARIRLSVLEDQQASAHFSEAVPVESGRTFGQGGQGGPRSVPTYITQNFGTRVDLTARVEQDGMIVLQLQAERTRLIANRPAGEEAGAANIAARTTQARVQTTTRAKSGTPAIVGSQQSSVGNETIHTYFVLTSSVPEGGKTAEAAPPLVTKVFALSHARASEMAKTLLPILEGQRITLAADERTNSLIVHGSADVLDVASALISRLDEAQARLAP
jgi:type II secretory pathway component GspD/PulD (secretin)